MLARDILRLFCSNFSVSPKILDDNGNRFVFSCFCKEIQELKAQQNDKEKSDFYKFPLNMSGNKRVEKRR